MPGLINYDGTTGLAYKADTELQWQAPIGTAALIIQAPTPPPEE